MLDGHVLVLNRSWAAVHVASVKRALCMLFQGVVHAVHPTNYTLHSFEEWCELPDLGNINRKVNTPSFTVAVPEVILLKHFNGFVYREVNLSRRNIFERDRLRCQYCGKFFPRAALTIDHVIPQSRGGQNTWENLVLACSRCNVRKGNRTPEEAGMPLLRKPVKPSWLPQFGIQVPTQQLTNWQRFTNGTYWDFHDGDRERAVQRVHS